MFEIIERQSGKFIHLSVIQFDYFKICLDFKIPAAWVWLILPLGIRLLHTRVLDEWSLLVVWLTVSKSLGNRAKYPINNCNGVTSDESNMNTSSWFVTFTCDRVNVKQMCYTNKNENTVMIACCVCYSEPPFSANAVCLLCFLFEWEEKHTCSNVVTGLPQGAHLWKVLISCLFQLRAGSVPQPECHPSKMQNN